MAKATRVGSPQGKDMRSVQLTLSVKEAEVLACVCRKISGDPGKSPRGSMDAIQNALIDAGVEEIYFSTGGPNEINFMDY